jgi:hypothetical protein
VADGILSAPKREVKKKRKPFRGKSLSGKKFWRLAVECFSHRDTDYRVYWRCRCHCGKESIVRGDQLVSGGIRSCGCARLEKTTTHGHCRRRGGRSCTVEYAAWHAMHHRCKNPANKQFHRYGGRGITVCERWEKFENFLADMGLKQSPDLSIERIDNDAGYSPENCKWATLEEQNANRHHAKSYNRRRCFGKHRKRGLTSKFKRVSLYRRDNVWVATIRVEKWKSMWLGRFATEIEAAKAYNEAARKHHGEGVFLNEISD